jgi:hypothetical protein
MESVKRARKCSTVVQGTRKSRIFSGGSCMDSIHNTTPSQKAPAMAQGFGRLLGPWQLYCKLQTTFPVQLVSDTRCHDPSPQSRDGRFWLRPLSPRGVLHRATGEAMKSRNKPQEVSSKTQELSDTNMALLRRGVARRLPWPLCQ